MRFNPGSNLTNGEKSKTTKRKDGSFRKPQSVLASRLHTRDGLRYVSKASFFMLTYPAVGITGQPSIPHLVEQGTEDGPLEPLCFGQEGAVDVGG